MTTPQKHNDPASQDQSGAPTPPDARAQRDALLDAERKAAERQPDSFMDGALTDKVVGIPPVQKPDDKPIQGLDPK